MVSPSAYQAISSPSRTSRELNTRRKRENTPTKSIRIAQSRTRPINPNKLQPRAAKQWQPTQPERAEADGNGHALLGLGRVKRELRRKPRRGCRRGRLRRVLPRRCRRSIPVPRRHGDRRGRRPSGAWWSSPLARARAAMGGCKPQARRGEARGCGSSFRLGSRLSLGFEAMITVERAGSGKRVKSAFVSRRAFLFG